MIYFYIFIIVEKKVPNLDLLSFWVRMSALLELRYTLKLIRLNSFNSCGRRSIAIPKYSYVGNERTLKDRQKFAEAGAQWRRKYQKNRVVAQEVVVDQRLLSSRERL